MPKIIVDKFKSLKYRFEMRFDKKSTDECWIWNGVKNKKGYGNYNNIMAHRLSYKIYIGPIPKNKIVCHHCDNPSCVNPKHLWIGTIKENNKDRDKKGRFIKLIGEKHGKSVITEKLAKEIKNRIINGEPLAKIARELNLKYSTVANIKQGTCWNHI